MMSLISIINVLLALGIIAGQIFVVLLVLYFLVFGKQKNALVDGIAKHGMLLAFLVALVSTCGSLFYSQIAGFPPCDLCWFQRIFIYPQVVLLGLALIKKDSHIVDYALALLGVGTLISLYHNYIYYFNNGLNAYCQVASGSVSCIKRYVFEFGYITIPVMALTAFLLMGLLLLMYRMYMKQQSNAG